MCAFASAQVVETGSMKDNWYISGNVGTTIWDNHRSWAEPNDVLVNIAIGKEITPIFGLELDMMAGMNQGNKTFFDSHNLTANVTTNLTNLICGYNGDRRLFEPILIVGAGWYHTYGDVYNNVSAIILTLIRPGMGCKISIKHILPRTFFKRICKTCFAHLRCDLKIIYGNT